MRRYAFAASFATGFAVMGAELGVARLLAPFFGSSTPVWAFIIGTVMGSLSLGYLAGGRLASKPRGARVLPILIAGGGLALFLVPWILTPLLRGTLSLFLRGAVGHLFTLAALAAPLFAVPFFLLGATSPLLLQAVAGDGREVGRAGAWLYALGTWGGLLGTFVSGLVLIPLVGSRVTFTACGAGLLLVAAAGLRRRGRTVAAGVAITASVLASLAEPLYARTREPHTIYEAESAYHTMRVLDDRHERRLTFDEGFATQSLRLEGGVLPLHDVWGYYALAPAWTASGVPRDVLVLGLGAGTSARSYAALYPDARVTGVEIDPAVVEVGRRFFALPGSTRVVVEDARPFVDADRGSYDVILIDAFHFPYIPFQLTTVEFFEGLKKRLRKGGVAVFNVGRDGEERDVVHAVAATLARVFPHVLGVDVPNPSNTMLVAMEHVPEEMVGVSRLGLEASVAVQLGRLPRPKPWRIPSDAPVLTDDLAPLEWMTDRIMLRRMLKVVLGGET